MDFHKLYMVGKRRFSALKCILVCENRLRIEATGAILKFRTKIKKIQQTIMMSWPRRDVVTSQTPSLYDYPFNLLLVMYCSCRQLFVQYKLIEIDKLTKSGMLLK